MPSRGIFVTALGDRYRRFARLLVDRLHLLAPHLPMMVLTDVPGDVPVPAQAAAFPFAGEFHTNQRGKLQVAGLAPWDEVLVLDADVVPRDLDGIWLTARDDCPSFPRDQITPTVGSAWYANDRERDLTFAEVRRDFPHYNTGVFVYRRTAATMIFFRDWITLAEESGAQDEPPLARLLVRKKITPPEMPATYSRMPAEASDLGAIVNLYRDSRAVHLWGGRKDHLESLYREISA